MYIKYIANSSYKKLFFIFIFYNSLTVKLNNEIKQYKRNQTCQNCHVNAWNAACFISYQ